MALTAKRDGRSVAVQDVEAAARPTAPVKIWATIGGLAVALQVYVGVAWLTSGDLVRTPAGNSPTPAWLDVAVRSVEVVSVAVACIIGYLVLIRPLRRDKRLSTEGLICLGCLSMAWQDPLLNVVQPVYFYNAKFVNFGSWLGEIPGVVWPGASKMAEPLFLCPWGYLWSVLFYAMAGVKVSQWVRARRPRLTSAGQMTVVYATIFVVDVMVESTLLRLQLLGYPGVPGPSIVSGHQWALPIWEPILVGALCTPIAYLWMRRDDKGRTVAERGIDQLAVRGGRQTLIRALAIAGYCNVIFVLTYNGPFAALGLHAKDWPASTVVRSDLRGKICGEGTTYTCNLGSGTPIPRRGSAHIGPDGKLVAP